MMLMTIVATLHEIEHYENDIVEKTFISLHAFQKLIKQIFNQYEIREKDSLLRTVHWENSAIFAP